MNVNTFFVAINNIMINAWKMWINAIPKNTGLSAGSTYLSVRCNQFARKSIFNWYERKEERIGIRWKNGNILKQSPISVDLNALRTQSKNINYITGRVFSFPIMLGFY